MKIHENHNNAMAASSSWDWSKLLALAATGTVAAISGYLASKEKHSDRSQSMKSKSIVTFQKAAILSNPSKQARNHAMRLYHSFPYKSTRCLWLITELGVSEDFDVIRINFHGDERGRMRNQYKQEIHPHGTVPALILNNRLSLLESGAICLYIADIYAQLAPWTQDRAEYYNWIVYACSTVDPVLDGLYKQLMMTLEEKRDLDHLISLNRRFRVIARNFSDHLSDRTFICGKEFTAADCVVGYSLWWASIINSGELLQDFPVLNMYLNRLKSRPAFLKSFTPNVTFILPHF